MCTEKYFPNEALVKECEAFAKESGATITLTEDVKEGTKGADVIYTDVWVSMGEPDEVWEERIKELSPYKVTKEVMENAGVRQFSFTACRHSMIWKQRSVKRWENALASKIWK